MSSTVPSGDWRYRSLSSYRIIHPECVCSYQYILVLQSYWWSHSLVELKLGIPSVHGYLPVPVELWINILFWYVDGERTSCGLYHVSATFIDSMTNWIVACFDHIQTVQTIRNRAWFVVMVNVDKVRQHLEVLAFSLLGKYDLTGIPSEAGNWECWNGRPACVCWKLN